MASTFTLPYGGTHVDVRLTAGRLLGVLSPHPVTPSLNVEGEIRSALGSPIGTRHLSEAAHGAQRVLILADDLTRRTPVQPMISLLVEELHTAGIRDHQVAVLIALGTHRPMTSAEIETRFGSDLARRVRIENSPWQNPDQLVDLGTTPNGTPVQVTRPVLEADFIIGLGSVVPHHIAGFSGGAKIVQPGVTGAATTGATHLFSTRADESYLGQLENPVRAEMEAIAAQVGLKAVLNTVLDHEGRLVRAFFGEPCHAFRAAAEFSTEVYGVAARAQSHVVVAGAHPCDIEFWQAHKSLYPAERLVRRGGTIIVVASCPEGVTTTHRDMLEYTALDAHEIEVLIRNGVITDLVSGALALAWAKVRRHAHVSLVSEGISDDEAKALGFHPFPSLDDALQAAVQRYRANATVTVLTHAPEMLPILTS
ncbi:MAG: nickel-dependent lactate racemase [Candidatus Hydrogenedentes bacterium]|nr:nickel-dependent lactate racemase [Candidatus Hydrogenedentota bacterium]